MGTAVDERVVSMRFDNQQFLRGVNSTVKSLATLRKSLDLENAAKGLVHLGKESRNFSMDGMGRSIDTIASRFTHTGMVGTTVLTNLVNSAVNAGKRIATALTIAPIKGGFAEYELKMGSVQTIMASTGEELGVINGYLEELNRYSDKTIYSFKDMTSNIGKFTNAGVSLEDAVMAIKGISNEAAVSGANAQEASRAMYNFSQALSAGYVKLIDWKSIENANMATKEFKQQLIDTAVEMGTLVKKDGMYISTTKDMTGKVSQAFNSTKNFNEALSHQWMTSEVLVKTLEKYADETTEIGKKAYSAAQDIKTFHQLLDTVKESIESGWAQISEIVFGDLIEAKELWTKVGGAISNTVDGVFGKFTGFLRSNLSSEYKNFLHDGPVADVNEFEELMNKAADNRDARIQREIDQNNAIIAEHERLTKENDLYNKLQEEKAKDWWGGHVVDENGQSIWWMEKPEAVKEGQGVILRLKKANEELNSELEDESYNVETVGSAIENYLDINLALSDEQRKQKGITEEQYKQMQRWRAGLDSGAITIKELVDSFNGMSPRVKLIEALGNNLKHLGEYIKPVRDAFSNVFFGKDYNPHWLKDWIDKFYESSKLLKANKDVINGISKSFTWFFNFVKKGFNIIKQGYDQLKPVMDNLVKGIKPFFDSLKKLGDSTPKESIFGKLFGGAEKESKGFSKIISDIQARIEHFKDTFGILGDKIGEVFQKFNKSSAPTMKLGERIQSIIDGIFDSITELIPSLSDMSATSEFSFDKFGKSVSKFLGGFTLDNLLDVFNSGVFTSIMIGFKKFVDNLGKGTTNFKNIGKGVLGVLESAKNVFGELGGVLKAFTGQVKAGTLMEIAKAVGLLAIALIGLALVDPVKLGAALIAVGGLMAELVGSLYALEKMISGTSFKGIIKSLMTLNGAVLAMQGVAKAILTLSFAMILLSTLEWDEMARGLISVGGLLAEVGVFMSFVKPNRFNSKGIVKIAIAMNIFAVAMKNLGQIDTDTLIAGGLAMLSIFTMLGLFIRGVSGSKSIKSIAAGMIMMAGSMILFSQAIKFLGSTPIEVLGPGLAAMGASLLAVGLAARYIPNNIVSIGFGVLTLAAAVAAISASIKMLTAFNPDQLIGPVLAISTIIGVLAVSAHYLNDSVKGAAALDAAMGSIGLLAPSLKVLASIPIEKLGTALLGLGASIAILGAAGALLGHFTVALIGLVGLSAAMALFGLGLLGLGAGVLMFSMALATLAVSGTAGAAALSVVINTVGELIPVFATKVGQGIIAIATVIGQGAMVIGNAVSMVILAIVTTLASNASLLVNAGLGLLSNLLTGIADNIGQITESALRIVSNFVSAIATTLPDVIQSGIDLMLSFINGMANGIRDNSEKVFLAIGNLISSTIELLLTGLQLLVKKIPGVGEKMSEGLEKAKSSVRSALTSEEMTKMGSDAMTGLESGAEQGIKSLEKPMKKGGEVAADQFFVGMDNKFSGEDGISGMLEGAFDPSKINLEELTGGLTGGVVDQFTEMEEPLRESGRDSANDYGDGLKLGGFKVWQAGSIVAEKGVKGADSKDAEFKAVGTGTTDAVAQGIDEGSHTVEGAAARMAQAAVDACMRIFNGPNSVSDGSSGSLEEIGANGGLAMANGLQKSAIVVEDSAKLVSQSAINTMQDTINTFSDAIMNGVDTNPTIRPVMDLSDIESGKRYLGSMLSEQQMLNVGITTGKARAIYSSRDEKVAHNESSSAESTASITFNQYNTSPKPLSRIDIYRQTKNQISQISSAKGVVKPV